MSNWCILRTAPSRTVLLATVLTAAGFRAWTPQAVIKRSVPRSNAKKKVAISLTPTVVFADYEQLPALLALSRSANTMVEIWDDDQGAMISRPVPPFFLFKPLDTYPRVRDNELDALRVAEQRGRPATQAPVFTVGEAVRYADAGFQGLIGRVERVTKRDVLVSFGGFSNVAIPRCSLLPADRAA